MSAVVGIDLSTKALDLVKLDESSNRAEWRRFELEGKDAWERTLRIRSSDREQNILGWWDDVYLVALEAPYGHGSDLLNRVVGAVAASLPATLRSPERCWIVRPDEWKHGLGLKDARRKPTREFVWELSHALFTGLTDWDGPPQDALDAYCLAMWARDTLAKNTAAA